MENLERGDMYGWVDDIPQGSKQKFVECLNYFRLYSTVNILEIGSYTGCSLIGMLHHLPQANATVIDPWEDYEELGSDNANYITGRGIENMFYRNINSSGLENRVKIYRGKSHEILPIFIREKKSFDFIYVDGSHKCLDAFLDCCMAWQLLNQKGILAVDDYRWQLEQPVLNRPYEGVNHFLKLHEGQYKLLSNNYRLFLLKLL